MVRHRGQATTMFALLNYLMLAPNAHAWTRIDFVDPAYALSHSSTANTTLAQEAIIAAADEAAKHGPWSARSRDTRAPGGDPADYLSWAEDYFPDCGNATSASATSSTLEESTTAATTYVATASIVSGAFTAEMTMATPTGSPDRRRRSHPKRMDDTSAPASTTMTTTTTTTTTTAGSDDGWIDVGVPDDGDDTGAGLFQTVPKHNDARRTSTITTYASTLSSSTTSAAPSTSACPYVRKEGSTNPDTDSLPGPKAMDQAPEGILFNAVAYALTTETVYAHTANVYLRTLLVDRAINPSATYAGVVRGSADDQETADGIMDFRGLVKVANAIGILREAKVMVAETDDGVKRWSAQYLAWLHSNSAGHNASIAHGHLATIHYAQTVAMKLITGDTAAARTTLDEYFAQIWPGQVDQDGRQAYENGTDAFWASCLNLEGAISMAKIGSSLGADYWHTKTSSASSDGPSTIQSAVDYLMRTTDGSQDEMLAPHVAVAKAVYGDRDGIYAAFLQARGGDYARQPWWYFDQPEAFAGGSDVPKAQAQAEAQPDPAVSSSSPAEMPVSSSWVFSMSSSTASDSAPTIPSTASSTTTTGPLESASSTSNSSDLVEPMPTRRAVKVEQVDEEEVIINLGHDFASASPISASPSASASAIVQSSISTLASSSTASFDQVSRSPSPSPPAPSPSSPSASQTPADPTSGSATQSASRSASASSMPVFQESPGPVPPSPPNDACDSASSSMSPVTCASSSTGSTAATGVSTISTASSSASVSIRSTSTRSVLVHLQAEQSAVVKVGHGLGRRAIGRLVGL